MADKKYLIKVNQSMARSKDMPRYFMGVIDKQSPKAFHFVGAGVMLKKKLGCCSICARDLSDPNSIKLGIGPICAKKMGIDVLSGYTDKDIEKELHKIKINTWLPRTCVELDEDLSGVISAPEIEVPKEQKKEIVKKLEFTGDLIYIYFTFDSKILFKVKAISGRRYHKEPEPHWTCPNTEQNKIDLANMGFDVPDVKEVLIKTPDLPRHLEAVLMPFQKEGVDFIFQKKGRALIGDEMGLGKTIQACTFMEMTSKVTIITCPASLKLNWAAEINKWCTNYNLWIVEGKKKKVKNQIVCNKLANKDIYIVNWDILGNQTEEKLKNGKKTQVDIPYTGWVDYLLDLNPDLVIADEIHFAKNPKNMRSRGLIRMGKRIENFIGLSGTPIENRPVEFFSTLNLINGNLFSSWWNYTKRYCGAYNDGWGRVTTGCTNAEELHTLVKNVMIRRLKIDVLPELPLKRRVVIPVEITNRKTYDRAESNLLEFLKETVGQEAADKASQAEQLVQISKLRELAYQGKKKAIVNWIKEYLETEDKLVVFGWHTEVLDYLESHFKGIFVRIDGKTPPNKRQGIVDQFQDDPKIKLFFGSSAAYVGLTLTAANATAFVEFPWSPGQSDQAEDRVHRIGQKSDSVTAYYLIAEDTIDGKFLKMLDEKRKVVDGVLDGKEKESDSLVKILLAS